MVTIKNALVSVCNKAGVEGLCSFLSDSGVRIIASGGSKARLENAGISVMDASKLTGFPEILDGRVKTLHPKIHGGLLADRNKKDHLQTLAELDIPPIDLLIANLYRFEDDPSIENIDVGGPAMIRAAAKNFQHVCVITNPQDYTYLTEILTQNKMSTPEEYRRVMAQKAFALTASYDTMIASSHLMDGDPAIYMGSKALALRYGENDHQRAAFYTRDGSSPVAQLNGKDLSYNNILDAHAALRTTSDFTRPTVAIVKHNAPCAVASAANIALAYQRAIKADPVSSFGGIVSANDIVNGTMAEEIIKLFTEVVIAPGFDEDALSILRTKVNMRILEWRGKLSEFELRSALGGTLAQGSDTHVVDRGSMRAVTSAPFDVSKYLEDIIFAYTTAKHVTSNAIVIARDEATLGIGRGQPNRVDSARIALDHASDACRDSVLASDGFIPFPDTVQEAAKRGVGCIVQPGGSRNDEKVIEAANQLGIPMIFVGTRCFKH